MNWDYPDPHIHAAAATLEDIDGLRHTNNAVYVKWCEQAAWAHSEGLGLALADYHRLDRAMAIRRSEYDYLLPTVAGEPLSIGTWLVSTDGKARMERRFQVVRDADGVTVLRGRWELVCIQLSSGRVSRMPEEFRDVYLPAVVEAGG
jgi:acyl-CoA thioester hydrolase